MKRSRQRMSPWLVLGLLAGLGLGGCVLDTGDEALVPPAPSDAVRQEFRRILHVKSFHSGLDEPMRRVIRDADEWSQLWSQIDAGDEEPPAVDFSREMVLVAAMGERRHGGYAITIEGVFEDQDGVHVQVLETSPGASCPTTQALVAPVTIMAVPRRDQSVTWLEGARTLSC